MGAVYAGKKYADSRRKAKADLKNEEQAAQE
jgi:hypothetical protein